MKFKKTLFFLFLPLVTITTLRTTSSTVSELFANSGELYSKIKLLSTVIETIQRSYVEERQAEDLIGSAIKGMISDLDPHTIFLPADDFDTWNQSFEGYTGIGISFEVIQDAVRVMSVIENTPAHEAGLMPGDYIISVNNHSTAGLRDTEITRLFSGLKIKNIELSVTSPRWVGSRELHLSRERILLDSIPYAMFIQPKVGYIKIEKFTSTTPRELEQTLIQLEKEGMKYLLLDLRGNSGGYLNSAVEVADKFIPGGNSIVSTRGRLPSSFQEFHSTDSKTHKLFPLLVLIDHGSASAAEIVAGAIQDLDRGLIVGKTSFGKGLVQSQYRFQDGSALLITTARYYTPSGRPIQRSFFDKSKDQYYREAYLDKTDIAQSNPEQIYRTRMGRQVFAGHGIQPDIWIEAKNSTLSHQLRELYLAPERFFYSFAQQISEIWPETAHSEEYLIKKFEITDSIYQQFLTYLKSEKNSFNSVQFDTEKNCEHTKFLIKRELAFLLWGQNAWFRVNLQRDEQLQAALRYLTEANKLVSRAGY